MGRDFHQISLQIIHRLLRIFLTDLIYPRHNRPPHGHINLVFVAALVVHDLDTAVRQLLHGAFDSLIVRDGPAHDLHLSVVQRPLIGSGRGQHCPTIVHQESHRSGQVSNLPLCLCHDGGNLGDTHKHFRCSHPRKVYDLSVVPLVALYHIVQELLKVPLTDAGRALDGPFDLLQADPVGAKGPDILHRDFVQFSGQFQPGTYLVKEGCLQTAVQLGKFFWEGVQYLGAKKGISPDHPLKHIHPKRVFQDIADNGKNESDRDYQNYVFPIIQSRSPPPYSCPPFSAASFWPWPHPRRTI
nr:MAG TPA: hypothetical protein [Bacteriophage sp.]